jgi:hypothetical protein
MGHSVKTAEKHYVQLAALNADGAVRALDWGSVGEKTVTKTVTVPGA